MGRGQRSLGHCTHWQSGRKWLDGYFCTANHCNLGVDSIVHVPSLAGMVGQRGSMRLSLMQSPSSTAWLTLTCYLRLMG